MHSGQTLFCTYVFVEVELLRVFFCGRLMVRPFMSSRTVPFA